MILSRVNAFVSHLPGIMVYLVTKKIKEDIMVQNPDILRRFEDDLARKEGRIPYARAMKIFSSLDEQRHFVAYLDSVQARLASLRELQSATGEELSALLPSVLDRAFKGEL